MFVFNMLLVLDARARVSSRSRKLCYRRKKNAMVYACEWEIFHGKHFNVNEICINFIWQERHWKQFKTMVARMANYALAYWLAFAVVLVFCRKNLPTWMRCFIFWEHLVDSVSLTATRQKHAPLINDVFQQNSNDFPPCQFISSKKN